jgi:hypothetical protein
MNTIIGILLLICAVLLIWNTRKKSWLFPITTAMKKDLYGK